MGRIPEMGLGDNKQVGDDENSSTHVIQSLGNEVRDETVHRNSTKINENGTLLTKTILNTLGGSHAITDTHIVVNQTNGLLLEGCFGPFPSTLLTSPILQGSLLSSYPK